MRVSRLLCGSSLLALSLGCSPPLPSSTGSGGSNGGSTGEESNESSTQSSSESGSETSDPTLACTNEWDCGVGERCLDGVCTCLGCACQSPNTTPAGLTAPETDDDDEVPVFLDIGVVECTNGSDCGPLEACNYPDCVETTACVEHSDCYADWWPDNRFCVDGKCQWINCHAEGDDGCPLGALCGGISCLWLQVVPSCVDVPSFDEVVVHTLDAPGTASFVILDVNLDARDDVVVLDNGGVYWLTSTGVGFEPPTPWAVEPGTQIVAIAGADIHGDGVDELLVSHAVPAGVEILAVGASWPQWVGFAENMAVPEAARMLDVDFDGLPDIVTRSSAMGPTMLVEARLGDGTGTFEPLWTEEVEPFEFFQPAPSHDDEFDCARGLGSFGYDYLLARHFRHDGTDNAYIVVDRITAGHMFYPDMPQTYAGFVATAPLIDRGVLFSPSSRYHELGPAPGAVAFLPRIDGIHHVVVDHGIEAAELVQLTLDPEVEWDAFTALCRGSLGFSLDSVALDVGDFDGDGRQDLLSQGMDGVLRTWLSRD